MDVTQQTVQSTGTPPTSNQPASRRKVAVIAVHGVGMHAPGETQNSIADLLLSLPAGAYEANRTYAPFRSVGLQIPLQPLKTGLPVTEVKENSFLRPFHERSADFAKCLTQKQATDAQQAASPNAVARPAEDLLAEDVATQYNDLLLNHYPGGADGNAYVTCRLESSSAQADVEVHVYEVLWADLAKPQSNFLVFFLRLFQLLLHIGSLSSKAIDTGAAEATGKVWTAFRWTQRMAVRVLQIFVPVVEVLLFLAITASFSSLAKATHDKPLVAYLLGGVGANVLAFLVVNSGKWKVALSPQWWTLLALVPGGVGSLVAFGLVRLLGADPAAAVLWWLVPGAGFLYWILDNYKTIREGVQETGWILFCLSLLAFLYFLHHAPEPRAQVASFFTAEMLLAGVRMCWGVVIVLAIAAAALGSVAWRSFDKVTQRSERARARAAVRTSRLALAMPSVLFMLVTLLLWNGFTNLAEKELAKPLFSDIVKQQRPPGWTHLAELGLLPRSGKFGDAVPQGTRSAAKAQADADRAEAAKLPASSDPYVSEILAWSVGYQLPLTLVLVGLAGFLMTWWALPSVLTERFPPRGDQEPPRSSTNSVSLHMGTWLSRGLDATAVVTSLFWMAIFAAPAAFVALDWYGGKALPEAHGVRTVLDWMQRSTEQMVLGYAVLGTTILAALAKGGQTVLGVLLDVDTYLRTTPAEATPRAKIFERYASTLRYVDREEQGYAAIVIAAHSLGALISGDILRYIHVKRIERTRLPVSLFTYGNPTRQLLNRFFPYLYDWVRPEPDNSLSPLPSPAPEAPLPVIAEDALPRPEDLGVVHWASAYRSGDYVGRSLWLEEWFWHRKHAAEASGLEIVRSQNGGSRAEVCIGAGAHTHYTDDTAPEMARLLDSLIRTGEV